MAQLSTGTKRCSSCARTLPITEFWKNRATPDGLQAWCKDCRRGYYKDNAEQLKAYASVYRKENADVVRDYQRQYRERNAELLREVSKKRSREYYARNRERVLKRSAEWHSNNPEKVRKAQRDYYYRNQETRRKNRQMWARENPKKNAQQSARRRARERCAKIDEVDYGRIWERDKGVCYLCGEPIGEGDTHFDHVVPLARGGAHSMDNIKITHSRCNLIKKDRLLEELDSEMFDLVRS